MSNGSDEKQDKQHEQTPAETPAADDAPTAQTTPEQPDNSLELDKDAPPEVSAEVDPDLDLHLRGEDAEPLEPPDFGDPDDIDEIDPPDEPPTGDEPGPPDDLPPAEVYEGYAEPRAPLHHRLMRRPEGKVIAGVCSGLGAYTNTDPVLWRIGFVIFGVTSVGVLAYIVAWLIMPEARRGEPMPERPPHEAAQITRWAAVAAIILGCWVIFRGFFHIGGGWFWGLLLIGIGFAVWGREFTGNRGPTRPPFDRPPPVRPERWTAPQKASQSDRATRATPAPPANPATPSASASAWPGPRQGNTSPTRPLPPTRPPRYAPPRVSRRRESSYLGRLVVGACAVVIGIGLVLNNTGVIDLTAKGLLGVIVAIIGSGLVVGAWAGRARWLIFPGLGLTFALLLASWAPAFARGGFGQIVWQPQSRKALLSSYEHGAGEAVLDLTKVMFNKTPREVEVDVNFGELLVVIPEGVPVEVTTHVQGGEINNFGSNTEGWDVGNNWSDQSGDEDIGLLTIDAEVGFGQLTVRREQPGDDFTPGMSNGRRNRFNSGPLRIGRNS